MKCDETPGVTRRRLLKGMAAVNAVAAGGTSLIVLSACANRAPAEAPKPPAPIKLLALLPVVTPSTEQNASFGMPRGGAVAVPVQTAPGGISTAGAIGAIGVGLIVALVVSKNREERQKEQVALSDALSEVRFDPAAHIDRQLNLALEQRHVRVVQNTDPAIAAEIRNGGFNRLPEGVDAVLDISISESAYVYATRAGGFYPTLQVSATLLEPIAGRDELDGFNYGADWRDGGKDRRWVTSPKSMTYPSIAHIKSHATEVRSGLEGITNDIVGLMADDVQRHARGELRRE